ncbi:MAG TPA: hypothetical protein VFO15_14360, partial [Xanthobacteraceae bacterium]|nr:hypothetical protein [Xanthobacteraceae bacterium]
MYGSERGARGNSRPYRTRREFITLLGGAVAAPSFLWPLAARAQQPARLLWPNPVTASGHFVDAFRQGLGELGYVA